MAQQNAIYQDLWKLDLQHNGCSVSGRSLDGNWVFPGADILMDEQEEATGNADAAPAPLFHTVNEAKLAGETYQAFVALLNNYVANVRISEDHLGDNAPEDAEIEAFLDVILQTQVVQATFEFIKSDIDTSLTPMSFRAALLRTWFEIYTNHFNGVPTPFVSGFEHVMVGEGKTNGRGIGGYHSWIKFFLDERSGRVDFRGFNYDNNFNRSSKAGADFPYVATVSMLWDQQDMSGNVIKTLEKELGGFFVGPSPELQMALGTVAYFESEVGRYSQDVTGIKDDRKPVELMNGKFHLVMYRNQTEAQERGDKIRSFWPKFIGPVASTDADIVVPITPTNGDQNDGLVRIIRALANPEGSDLGREWVAIESNAPMIVDLSGWSIRDKEDRRQTILGSIEPGKTRRITLDRATPQSAQLGNRGGRIMLVDPAGVQVAAVSYEAASSGAVQHFVAE